MDLILYFSSITDVKLCLTAHLMNYLDFFSLFFVPIVVLILIDFAFLHSSQHSQKSLCSSIPELPNVLRALVHLKLNFVL